MAGPDQDIGLPAALSKTIGQQALVMGFSDTFAVVGIVCWQASDCS
ncbi:hypothetical protein [Bradyrhizobium sp. CCBAU 11357]|nr:hypothetical protein [Bradyrhizobium sp. CCBAU 11357]